MTKSVGLVFILLCLICEIRSLSLNVSIFYESLCPDCRRFVSLQVFPAYKKLGRDINLNLVPFGKATMSYKSGKMTFTCQHGPKECYGNEMQSCAIGLFSVEESTEFVYCAMSSSDPSLNSNLEKCANSTGISWEDLANCHETGQGAKFLTKNGYETKNLQPPLQWVPTIFFDGSFNQTLQNEARNNFEKVVCELLYYEPEGCRSYFDKDEIVLQMV